MSTQILTQVRVRELFFHEPSTGWLIRRISVNPRAMIGSIAGTMDTKGYGQLRVDNKVYRTHHIVWLYYNGQLPRQIDHKNRMRTDNRIENLRLATHTQNHANRTMNKIKTSKYKGVSRHRNKWQAQTKIKGEQHHLGVYPTQEEARDVYQAFMKKLHGEYFAP